MNKETEKLPEPGKQEKKSPEIAYRVIRNWNEAEIIDLYRAAGWWDIGWKPADIAPMIRGSFLFIIALDTTTGEAVGMGSIYSDGSSDGYIDNVVVHQDYRRRGIGATIIALLSNLGAVCGLSWIGLIAAPGKENFYKHVGFSTMEKHTPMKLGEKSGYQPITLEDTVDRSHRSQHQSHSDYLFEPKKNPEIAYRVIRNWNEAEIIDLYRAAGWWDIGWKPADIAPMIRGSFLFIIALDTTTGEAVGMGKIFSDGTDGYIDDVVVHQDYRGHGIGTTIAILLSRLGVILGLSWIDLIAAPGKENIYKRVGFSTMEKHTPMKFKEE